MGEQGHTPGPWTAENFDAEIDPDGGGEVWSVWKDSNGSGAEIAARICEAANARLIAAAPDLLEAARLVVNYHALDDEISAPVRALHSAISKAEAGS
jgi:hypothetical protein